MTRIRLSKTMKKLTPSLITTCLAILLVALTVKSDSDFEFANTVRLTGTTTSTAKTPLLVAVTNGPVSIAAMTNVWAAGVLVRTIENTGTNAVLYCLGGTVAATNHHGVLHGGSADRDGNGGVRDISHWPGAVTVMTESGVSTVVVTVVTQ